MAILCITRSPKWKSHAFLRLRNALQAHKCTHNPIGAINLGKYQAREHQFDTPISGETTSAYRRVRRLWAVHHFPMVSVEYLDEFRAPHAGTRRPAADHASQCTTGIDLQYLRNHSDTIENSYLLPVTEVAWLE